MNNILLTIIAAYIAIGILYYGYSCFLFREVINREDYLPLAFESLFCWPACLIVDIAFAIFFRRLMKPCEGDPFLSLATLIGLCEWIKSGRKCHGKKGDSQ